VYDVANFGFGLQNVYVDVPGTDSTAASGTVTDFLVTPFGAINISGLFQPFDLNAQLDPGAAFTFSGGAPTFSLPGLGDLFGGMGDMGGDMGGSGAAAVDPLSLLGL
jgi:hypothetical protein